MMMFLFSLFLAAPLVKADDTGTTTAEIFSTYQVTDLAAMSLTSDVSDDSFCGGKIYDVSLMYQGKYQGEDYRVELLLRAETQAQFDRIVSAVQANYATKGLPDCVKADRFRDPGISYTQKIVTLQPVDMPAGLCGGFPVLKPLTSCINVEKLYD